MTAVSTTPAFTPLDRYYFSQYCPINRTPLQDALTELGRKLPRYQDHADGFSARTFRRIHDLSGILAVINIIACIILFPYGLWFLYEKYQHNKCESLLAQQTFYDSEQSHFVDWLRQGDEIGLAQTQRQQPSFPGVLEALEALKTHTQIGSVFSSPTTIEKTISESKMDVFPAGVVYGSLFADTRTLYASDRGVAMKIYVNGEPQIMALYYRNQGLSIPEPTLSLYIYKKTADGCSSQSGSIPAANTEAVKNLITLFHQLGRFGHATVSHASGSSSEKLIHIGTTAGSTLPSLVLPVIREITLPGLS